MQNTSSKTSWHLYGMTLLAAVTLCALPDMAFAAAEGEDVFAKMLCDVAGWFSSGTGKAIATIAIIFLGIAAFFGKVTWGLALMFAVGIFAIFGASEIVDAIAGDEAGECTKASGGTTP